MLKEQKFVSLFFLTLLTLTFFALNSIFCRIALLNNLIDAYSFTGIRLISGAITLLIILLLKNKKYSFKTQTSWKGGIYLFIYAIFFSYSYINIDAGLGALILFGVVQITMILIGIYKGEKLSFQKLFGVIFAFLGLVYLLIPSKEFSLPILSATLMIISGIGWAYYTVSGKVKGDKVLLTTNNFIKASFLVVLSLPLFINFIQLSTIGTFYAILSGSITSAIGYFLWFYVVNKLDIITSSVIQLSVPLIAIFLGVLILNENLTSKLVISSSIILIGIFISIYKKRA